MRAESDPMDWMDSFFTSSKILMKAISDLSASESTPGTLCKFTERHLT